MIQGYGDSNEGDINIYEGNRMVREVIDIFILIPLYLQIQITIEEKR